MAKLFLKSYWFSLCFLFLLLCEQKPIAALSRDDFPSDFIFGAGTSALQVEGAAAEDGRKPSIWDPFCHAGKMPDHSNPDVAADQYHKYKEDVKLMAEMGLDAYRFSIAWPRLIPDGRGEINPKGLQYYNNLINELLSYGIQPHVTLYHFDLPLALDEEYNGLLSTKFIDDFTAYADVCFREFGDRVKNWITLNEPNVEPIGGYDSGTFPPERCSYPFGIANCTAGNSTIEPYIVTHNLLLGHASVVSLYREKYQAEQGGKIGITLLAMWFKSATKNPEDIAAARRIVDFHLGWLMDPLVFGKYPTVMRKIVGSRLPVFTDEDSRRVKGSYDFIGLNHYATISVQADTSMLENQLRDYMQDVAIKIPGLFSGSLDKVLLRKNTDDFFPPAPWGLSELLDHVKEYYGNPVTLIHENGDPDVVDPTTTAMVYDDNFRVNYLEQYLEALQLSIRNGSNTQGYFVWSLMDAWEIMSGYTTRFGLYGVDFSDEERPRYQRSSARWYAKFLGSKINANRDDAFAEIMKSSM